MTIQDEIELFFKNSTSVMFCGLDKEDTIGGQPLLYLFFSNTIDLTTPDIHKKISSYFTENNSKLVIFVNNGSVTRLSFVDVKTANSINIDKVSMTGDINEFIEETPKNEEIFLLSAYLSEKELLFSGEAVDNIPAKIYGYSLVYN